MRVFLSYRRVDSAGYAGRLYDRLTQYFGPESVFMDMGTIEPGQDFEQVITDAVTSCDVLIALMGRQWLTVTDSEGQRRLDNPEDFVRIEVETALTRGIPLVPTLVGDADVPPRDELPDSIAPLVDKQALFVSDTHFHQDVDYLIEIIEKTLDVQGLKPLTVKNAARITQIHALPKHEDVVRDVVFSPDGRLLATSISGGHAFLWDTGSWEKVTSLSAHKYRVGSVAFSPDGQQIALAASDRTISIWDAETFSILTKFEGHQDYVVDVAFSPDGQILASASHDGTIRLWDVHTREQLAVISGQAEKIHSVAFHPDGHSLAFGTNDIRVRIATIFDGKQFTTTPQIEEIGRHESWSSVFDVVFSPDGRFLLSASSDKTIQLWNIKNRSPHGTFVGHQDNVHTLALSPDGQLLASGSYDKTVRLWDVYARVALTTLPPQSDWVLSVAFSPDRRLLASASGHHVVIWGEEG